MRPIPAIASLCLWALAACGGSERPGRVVGEQDRPEVVALGDPQADPVQGDPTVGARDARLECETGISAEPDTSNVLNRNEIRTWARPGEPSGRPCPASSTSPPDPTSRVDTADPGAGWGTGVGAGDREGHSEAPASVGAVVPLVRGLTLVSAHRFPEGDRENRLTLTEVSPEGVMYEWTFIHRDESGKTAAGTVERFVRASDLASAPRANTVFTRQGRSDAPGYTAFSISRASYARLREMGETPHTVVSIQGGPLGEALGGAFATRMTLKGTLSLASHAPETMPVLLNGRRVTVPVLHLEGRFAFQDQREKHDYWVLADSLHPALLRSVIEADTVQTVSIFVPQLLAARDVDGELEKVCRVELPGVYFMFNSAELQAASEPALAGVAELVQRHPDWSFAIEGHTDSIGDPSANHDLSVRRAQAVRAVLVERYRIGASRLQAAGFGAARPREPNTTIEGRARNRRVELVRDCDNPRAR